MYAPHSPMPANIVGPYSPWPRRALRTRAKVTADTSVVAFDVFVR